MRKSKSQLARIDIDELFENSSNRGMLSFLERPPEEAQARLREKRRVNEADSLRFKGARGDLPPVGESPCAHWSAEHRSELPPESLPFPSAAESSVGVEFHPITNDLEDHSLSAIGLPEEVVISDRNSPLWESKNSRMYPEGESPLEVSHTMGDSPSGLLTTLPSLPQQGGTRENSGTKVTKAVTYPGGGFKRAVLADPTITALGKARARGDLPPAGYLTRPLDGMLIGRRQKIRRASIAQDGHSSGEQLLYQSLWNAGKTETPDTRLIAIGYSGMSALCKLEKSNCKKNIQTLIEKLAIDVIKTYDSATSTGRTFRVYSYKEILRRREAAGMIWVIRTSGVRFVHHEGMPPSYPVGDSPLGPVSDLPPDPLGEMPRDPVSKSNTPPIGEIPTQLGKDRRKHQITSALVHEALTHYGLVDDDVTIQLIARCRKEASACTEQEIIDFIHEKGRIVRASRNIRNPLGFLLETVPKCFAGKQYREYKGTQQQSAEEAAAAEAKERAEMNAWRAQYEARLVDPSVSEAERRFIRQVLGAGE